jgi:5-formyltetrahydrofolate cyclo-ligase
MSLMSDDRAHPTDAKRAMRARLRAARSALPESDRREAADSVAAAVMRELADRMPSAVLAYAPMPEELDPSPLVHALRDAGVRVAYPRVCGPGELALHWAMEDELAAGYCGVFEPSADAPKATLDEIDLVLVPGVAFDEACQRLGMGGGFYDRLLAQTAAGTLAIGLAFDKQVVASVPHEVHDAVMDAIVTPTRVLRRTETV